MAKQFTLGKKERLKSRKLIEQIFKEGKTFSIFPFRVYYLNRPSLLNAGESQPAQQVVTVQFGAGVATKNFKKAVDRNRIKRVIKEAWRLQKNRLQEKLKPGNVAFVVFLIYTARELPDYEMVRNKMNLVLNKLINVIDENNTPGS